MLSEAINAAIEGQEKTIPVEEKTPAVEETVDPNELTDKEKEDALALFRSLKDPSSRNAIVQVLAQNEGLIQQRIEQAETKKEIAEVKDEIEEAIREAFGTDLEFLSGPMAKALKATVGKLVDAQVKDVREKFEQTEAEKASASIESGLESVIKEFSISPEIQKLMLAEMENIQPSANISPKDYFTKIYKLVGGNTPSKPAPIEKKSAGPISRLGGMRSNSSGGEDVNTGKHSLGDAVRLAIEAASKKG